MCALICQFVHFLPFFNVSETAVDFHCLKMSMPRNFTTTTHGGVIFDDSNEDEDDSHEDEDDEEDKAEDVIEAIKVWVPIALTLVLVLLICFITIRAKTKRRRAREAGRSNPLTAVSGGVPMSECIMSMKIGNNTMVMYGDRILMNMG